MVDGQDAKYVTVIPPAAIIDNASATEVEIDTLGYHFAEVVVILGATDIAVTALKLQQTDTTGSGEADISGATFDGGTAIDGTTLALPSATDDNQICVFQVDLRDKKRFLSCVATFGDGSAGGFVSAVCRLSRGDVAETTSAGMANGGVLRV
jgi:hypothetical protein